jgi:type IV secretory pathway VirJ component
MEILPGNTPKQVPMTEAAKKFREEQDRERALAKEREDAAKRRVREDVKRFMANPEAAKRAEEAAKLRDLGLEDIAARRETRETEDK